MSHTNAYEADLRGLVEELENQDVFAPSEAEAWYDRIDETGVVSDYMMVNEAMMDVLDEREEVDKVLVSTVHNETSSFY